MQEEAHDDTLARTFFLLLAPLAPHIAEELWTLWSFGNGDISSQVWPIVDAAKILEETVVLPIQINGKVRGSIEVPVDIAEAELRNEILGMENIRKHIPDPSLVVRFMPLAIAEHRGYSRRDCGVADSEKRNFATRF